ALRHGRAQAGPRRDDGQVRNVREAARGLAARRAREGEVLAMAKKKLDITKLGRYKIISELGRGAMGVGYKAGDRAVDRTVALKTVILSDDAQGKAEYQKRFFLEAKAAGRLSHPQIITVYDFGQEGDLAYMAMEFLKGTELRTRMNESAISVAE